jgi:FdhD protein
VVDVDALFIADADAPAEQASCQVVEEDALSLDVEGVGYYTLMWTPIADIDGAQGFTVEDGLLGDMDNPEALALAMGFALSEGLIHSMADIRSLSVCPDDDRVVQIQLQDPGAVSVSRKNVVVNSSCGICGPREILENNALGLSAVPGGLALPRSALMSLIEQMRQEQEIFDRTGGSHAAAIFDAEGRLLAVAEDLGRHNALDKVIGMTLIQRGSLVGCGVVLSSRLSLEMVIKAVRAGLEVMVAVSAPTSLAIEVAERFGVTLCGFVRDTRATLFTHPQRILDA